MCVRRVRRSNAIVRTVEQEVGQAGGGSAVDVGGRDAVGACTVV